ncbi:MAG: hypothetical protein LBL19_08500 [Spirochaetaceae bacterium]|jgi:hypothetical protein|nr:hypothetical protein [Spirochaetaceae bacterium]
MDPITLAIFGVSSLVGAGMGWWSADKQRREKQAELERQKRVAWDQYELGKAYSDQQYTINRTEAHSGLAIQERRLDQDVDSSIGQFNTGLLGQAYGIQDAQIQTASGIGASRAAEGMSGTRGNEANELVRAYAQQGLDRNIGLQYQQNDQALSGMITQANRGVQDISRERASWDAGGYRYESKAAQDSYNRQMAEMGQSEFDWAIANASSPEDYAMSILGGASSGLSLASSLYGAMDFMGGGSGGTTNSGYGKSAGNSPLVNDFVIDAAVQEAYPDFFNSPVLSPLDSSLDYYSPKFNPKPYLHDLSKNLGDYSSKLWSY